MSENPREVVMSEHLDPVAVRVNSILANHRPAQGMKVAMGQTCQCGYWTGEERPGYDKPVGNAMGSDGLDWHRAQLIAADHVEALRQAEQRGKELQNAALRDPLDHLLTFAEVAQDDAYRAGQRDTLTAVRDALSEAMRPWWGLAPYQAVSETIQRPIKGDSDE
jgi:hypothetical protein